MTKGELLARIEEIMTRIWGRVPDAFFKGDFDKYKAWISEPFLNLNYEEYDDSSEL